jgi:CheY-like chemotaxis protein
VDQSFTREYGGTGLGLVIVKQLLQLMGGGISLNSTLGKGSNFYGIIPVLYSEIDTKETLDIKYSLAEILYEKRILLVEDDLVNQIVMSKMLEQQKLGVTVANNGKEAITICQNEQFDLILMDIQMPELDGIQATKCLRTLNNSNANLPIIALTAYALKGDETLFLASGMDDYLSKPVTLNQLIKTVEKHLLIPRIHSNFILPMMDKLLDKANFLISSAMLSVNQFDYPECEQIAHQLKDLFKENELEELRQIAFRIELDARKSKGSEIIDGLKKLRQLCDFLNDQGENNENINRRG